MPELRKLNGEGTEQFRQFLLSLFSGAVIQPAPPLDLLAHPATSVPVPGGVEVELQEFGSRLTAARYLDEKLSALGPAGIMDDIGLWAWLALFYFDELCRPDRSGVRNPHELARWIPERHAFRYYRHLLAGPFLIYRVFRDSPDDAAILLSGKLDKPGDFVGQLASRQEFITNRALIAAANALYYDKQNGRPKRGAAPNNDYTPGTLRRFISVIDQFHLTYDLYSMSAQDILKMLPEEFDRWRPRAVSI